MRVFRTVVSALAIFLGALSMVVWALSLVVVRSVEDPETFSAIATRTLENPAVQATIVAQAQDGVDDQLTSQGVNLRAIGADVLIDALIATTIRSQAFSDTVADQMEDAHEKFLRELTQPDRPAGPMVIHFDISHLINVQIDSVPLIGGSLPDVALPPVPVEVMGEQTFGNARTSFAFMDWAKTWLIWIALALLAVGLVASPRRRWFLAKFFTAVGMTALLGWALITTADPETLANALPGGSSGVSGELLANVVSEESVAILGTRALWVGFGSLALAALAAAIAIITHREGGATQRDDPAF